VQIERALDRNLYFVALRRTAAHTSP
jgi:hypothetical protein